MRKMDSSQVMLGTWGELWIDDEYMAEVTKARAEVKISYDDIKRVRNLMTGKKMTGLEGEGEVEMHKVSSFMLVKINQYLKEGKTPKFTMIIKLDDPDAIGGERVALYDVKFEKMTLADWENAANGKESFSFTFEDWDVLDTATE